MMSRFGIALSALCLASSVHANDVTQSHQVDPVCELHIWSTTNINAVDRDDSYNTLTGSEYTFRAELSLQERMARLFTPEFQRAALEGSELTSHPVLRERRLVWHDTSSPQRRWNDKKAMAAWPRLSDSDAKCYSELHYGWITFLDQPGKDVLQSGWLIRHFGDAALPQSWGFEGGYEKTEREFWTGEMSPEETSREALDRIRENFRKFLTRRKIERVLREMQRKQN